MIKVTGMNRAMKLGTGGVGGGLLAILALSGRLIGGEFSSTARTRSEPEALFARTNLFAWCIVPFDAKKRGPEERAAMLERLGFQAFAYDYRTEHIPTFDDEMRALKKRRIRLLAWWFPWTLNDEARMILDVLGRHDLRGVQLWVSGGGDPVKNAVEQEARVEAEATRIRPIAEAAASQGCDVALYNHGGWFGEPENQIAIIERLRRDGVTNVGIVYNQHHGHDHVDRFTAIMRLMKPHLMALNLNGMVRDGDKKGQKILPIGQGDLDLSLLRTICDSGWHGPIGILNHTDEDAEVRLKDNLDGLDWLVRQLVGRPAGPRPQPRSGLVTDAQGGYQVLPAAFDKAIAAGMAVAGRQDYRERPLTIECWAKLNSSDNFNILAACDTKSSSNHWELYSYAGSGVFSVYQPGWGGEFKSSVSICNGKWHYLAAILEAHRVRLYVNGTLVLDQPASPAGGVPAPSELSFGRLVEGGIGCDGLIDEVRISSGERVISGVPREPFKEDNQTIGLWHFDN